MKILKFESSPEQVIEVKSFGGDITSVEPDDNQRFHHFQGICSLSETQVAKNK